IWTPILAPIEVARKKTRATKAKQESVERTQHYMVVPGMAAVAAEALADQTDRPHCPRRQANKWRLCAASRYWHSGARRPGTDSSTAIGVIRTRTTRP
ncbi:hypothetical protein GGH92_010469, partial [Coemansia sp. RSA 2673]